MGALWFFLSERKNNQQHRPVSSEQAGIHPTLIINAAVAPGFRLCGGGQRAFRSPFGNLRPLRLEKEQSTLPACCIGADGNHPTLIMNAAAAQGFRLCGGGQRAFRSPFGNLRPLRLEGKNKQHEQPVPSVQPTVTTPQHQRCRSAGIPPLRRRPKGFPVALWKPSVPSGWSKGGPALSVTCGDSSPVGRAKDRASARYFNSAFRIPNSFLLHAELVFSLH